MDSALFHTPTQASGDGLVLTHGAGSNCRSELLVAVANAFAEAGVAVLRYDLPFRQLRKSGPPVPARAADDRAGLSEALDSLRQVVSRRLFVGGHSYGGRQASMLLAEQPAAASGLLLLSYPLHPPDKPQQLRTGHFGELRTPALFVHGTADPFGTVGEMTAALAGLHAGSQLSLIEGGGHDLKRGRFDIRAKIVEPFFRLFDVG